MKSPSPTELVDELVTRAVATLDSMGHRNSDTQVEQVARALVFRDGSGLVRVHVCDERTTTIRLDFRKALASAFSVASGVAGYDKSLLVAALAMVVLIIELKGIKGQLDDSHGEILILLAASDEGRCNVTNLAASLEHLSISVEGVTQRLRELAILGIVSLDNDEAYLTELVVVKYKSLRVFRRRE